MGIFKRHLLNCLQRYRDERDGATAVEFAILLVPFSAMLFAVIELGIVFFIQTTLSHAMQQASRDIRTGEFQTTGGLAAAFSDKVCAGMVGLGSCGNLRIDVVSSDTGRFQPNLLAPTPTSNPSDASSPPPMPVSTYTPTGPRDVVVVRVQYYHDLAFPGEYTRLANASGNVRIIEAVTAFRNEPF